MARLRLTSITTGSGTLDERSDDELMILAQGGSTEAFGVLVSRHGAQLIAVCARFVGDAELGAELAQETWVLTWERRQQYRAGTELRLWLFTTARNRCRNHLRSVDVRHKHRERAAELGTSAPPEQIERLLSEERLQRVQRALGRLPESMREALLLRYGEELRYDEIARVLGSNESTLRSRVHLGLKSLKDELEKQR